MGAQTGSGVPGRGRAGRHRRTDRALIQRRDHAEEPAPTRRLTPPAPSPSALVGIAVLVLIAVGVVHLSATGSAVPVRSAGAQVSSTPEAGAVSVAPPVDPPGTEDTAVPSAPVAVRSATTGATIVVHVSGAVAAPGVVHLPGDARVDDALRAAGGATGEADLAAVNLARPLADGEQIHVPIPGEEPRPGPADPSAPSGGSPGTGPASGAPVDLNTADAATLEELPGVGPAIAQRIVEHREKNGSFASVDELLEVSGIGPATLEEIRGRATV